MSHSMKPRLTSGKDALRYRQPVSKRTCLTLRQRDAFLVNRLCQEENEKQNVKHFVPVVQIETVFFFFNKKEETVLVSFHWKHTLAKNPQNKE